MQNTKPAAFKPVLLELDETDRDCLHRRAASMGTPGKPGSIVGVVRALISEAKALRHGTSQPRNTLALLAEEFERAGDVDRAGMLGRVGN